MKEGDKVKITKISKSNDPKFDTSSWDQYILGDLNKLSPPVDYWLTGSLMSAPAIGQKVAVFRDSRNGIKALGHFVSSEVKSFGDKWFETQNSIYRIELI